LRRPSFRFSNPADIGCADVLIRPYGEHCIECFSWVPVMFGGDWPVCSIASSLGCWVKILKEIVGKESVTNQEKLFAKNAERIYRLAK
jgi:L-fuconolactonase